jgi:hypothetical protein
MANLRQLVAGSMVGLGLAGIATAGDQKYSSINDVPEVTIESANEKTKEGFSFILIYGSKPTTDDSKSMARMANSLYLDVINQIEGPNVEIYKLNTQRIADNLGTIGAVTEVLESSFGIRKRPAFLMYCNGERMFKLEALPTEETYQRGVTFLNEKISMLESECQ